MKIHAIAAASALAIAPAFAQWDGPYSSRSYSYGNRADYARVVETTPVYAESRQECWNPRTAAYEERRDRRSIGAGAAVGALAGGVLGHQIDQGEGTAAGAILGGIIGHQIERQRDRDDDLDLSNCRITSYGTGVQGYDVRYRYAGNEYVTRMAYDPGQGRTLRLGSDVNWDGTPIG